MKFAILTSGGDAPGMNAMIINLSYYLQQAGHHVFLVQDGYEGLLDNNFIAWNEKYNIHFNEAGSFIGSSRSKRFLIEYQKAITNLKNNQIDKLIVIGGNGSYCGSKLLNQSISTIFIPATIDNDIDFSDYCLGFDSALQEIIQQSRKLIYTFKTHKNIIFLEVMGRLNDDLVNNASKVIQPALTLSHKNKLTCKEICSRLTEFYKKFHYALVLLTENLYSYEEIKLILKTIEEQIHCAARFNVLGYTQRGANVTKTELSHVQKITKLTLEAIINKQPSFIVRYKNNQWQIQSFTEELCPIIKPN